MKNNGAEIKGSYENLEVAFRQSDRFDIQAEKVAYEKYNILMSKLSEKYGFTTARVVAVFVSTSPNNDYKNNVRSTVSILEGYKAGRKPEDIKISTYNHCKMRALEYLDGKDFLSNTKGLKIKSFYLNILNPFI